MSFLNHSSPLADKQFSQILIELGTILGESHGYGCFRFKFFASFASVILLNASTKLKIENELFLKIYSFTLHLKIIQLISIHLPLYL